MSNRLLFSSEARNKMASGVNTLANAVKVTLGPKGKNVIIEQDFGAPLIINDGVSIAKAISLEDQFENLGSSILIEAATKTNDLVGDGTTTAILLTSKLIIGGMKKLEDGVSSVVLRNGLNYYLTYINESIDEVSQQVSSLADLNKIATISSGIKEVGDLIEDAFKSVGKEGIITIEDSQGMDDYLDVVKGYSIDKGYVSSYMVNNEYKNESVLEKPYVLVTDQKIISMQELLPFLELSIKNSKPLFILCDDIEQEVLAALVVNKLRGVFTCVVVKAPSFGERKINQLKDICLITGATLIDSSIGLSLGSVETNVLGISEKIIVNKDKTIVLANNLLTDEINEYAYRLQEEKKYLVSTYDIDSINQRIAKILGGIAQIKVGAETEVVLKEKKLRIEDALNASYCAMKSGVIEGGGKVFFNIAQSLKNYQGPIEYTDAKDILIEALQSPFIQICENAGKDYQQILKQVKDDLWYDAQKDKIVNMKQSGIIDPASVEKSAILTAVSIAGIFLTTECAIVSNNKEKLSEENLL